ncbi:MAG TPA: DUF2784 domain-containing protein [Alphaproteobacteria bacterium]|jgi:hypothetical protein|nr:DUF2784 domain-containing protein [Alphaproteobacteria bacterium]MDP7165020.1 DUF2784 domain-containing protein [Alphaproteobacteria bacterium]MDP7429232.1 DUF2784 domain-containing protein [Alphaproteobacteria bacterium]HJM52064.1 DUF2784 domain-containing protein [Alphaproteobacteria bacterium]|tara:strand:+ start:263 stop:697 length:435 start_codon:yes stop_codon:yes gene_type:complete
MLARLLADLVLAVHLGFVVFVVAGGFFVWRWPKLAWLHLPAFVWGGGIELLGWICPLTYLENHLRRQGALAGYETSFIEQYLLPLLYPEVLLGSFPRWGFVAMGISVLVLNGLIYWRLIKRHLEKRRQTQQRSRDGYPEPPPTP